MFLYFIKNRGMLMKKKQERKGKSEYEKNFNNGCQWYASKGC